MNSSFCHHLLIAGFLLLNASGLRGAVPAVDGLFPCGGKVGSSVEVSLSGKVSPWPPKFWCSNPKLSCKPGEKAPAVTITIAGDTKPGPVLMRFYNEEGSSELIHFLVGDSGEREVVEDEKQNNNGPSDAQEVKEALPCAVYGRLSPSRDVDCYQVPLKKGQRFFAYLEGYSFRTGLDPILHLYDSSGDRIALAHDSAVNPDPQLVYEINRDGNYTVAVMAIATPPNANVSYHGGTKCSYRLNLAVQRGDLPARILPAPGKPDGDKTKPLAPPLDLFGTLAKPDQTDSITFLGKAKQKYEIEALAFPLRYPTDPVLVVKKSDGTLIREVDDGSGKVRDGTYLWTAPVDDQFIVAIRDRFGKSGPDFRYNLRIHEPKPAFDASTELSNFVLEAGKDIEVKVKVTRVNGHKAPLKLTAKNLPAGVSVDDPKIPEKTGDVSVKLKAEKTAKAFSGPITFWVKEAEGEKKAEVIANYTFQGKDARGPYLIDESEQVWLTVKEEKKKSEPAPDKAKK